MQVNVGLPLVFGRLPHFSFTIDKIGYQLLLGELAMV
jgi:hypothetical protein